MSWVLYQSSNDGPMGGTITIPVWHAERVKRWIIVLRFLFSFRVSKKVFLHRGLRFAMDICKQLLQYSTVLQHPYIFIPSHSTEQVGGTSATMIYSLLFDANRVLSSVLIYGVGLKYNYLPSYDLGEIFESDLSTLIAEICFRFVLLCLVQWNQGIS